MLARFLNLNVTKSIFLPLLAAGSFVQAGCSQDSAWKLTLDKVRSDFPAVQQIGTDSLAAMLRSNAEIVLLDTRTPDEYNTSHLKNAIWIDPDNPDMQSLEGIDSTATIVAYCSVGYRSSAVAEKLSNAGFSNVSNLEGSIFKWANEGRPVYRDSVETTKVHPYDKFWGRLLNKDLRSNR